MATPSKPPNEPGALKLFLVPVTIRMLQSGVITEDSFKLDNFDVKSVSYLFTDNKLTLGRNLLQTRQKGNQRSPNHLHGQ